LLTNYSLVWRLTLIVPIIFNILTTTKAIMKITSPIFRNLIVLLSVALASSAAQSNLPKAAVGNDELFQNQCGGPLEADSDSLTYPRQGQSIQPGEMCVWTIHLQTTKAFAFNFTNLNVNSSSECADGSVRIYSLTNLVATENLESYTFCNGNPAPANFFLTENVAAVVFYAGSNPGPNAGFTLNWAGTAYNPIPTTHVTSYSTSPNGLIRHPVDGEYEPNTIATWLVRAGRIDEEINLNLNLTSLNLEPCANVEDRCVCDALILYEITDDGVLSESERFCGERSSAVKERIQGNFVLAFYSDFNSISGSGNGFELQYKPIEGNPITTTIEPVETTTARPSTPCGTVIQLNSGSGFTSGQIIYKPDEIYNENERCVWTIRSETNEMQFRLEEQGFETVNDRVLIDLFEYGTENGASTGEPFVGTIKLTDDETGANFTESGCIAIITFRTEGNSTGKGFVLSFASSGQPTITRGPRDVIDAQSQGSISQGPTGIFVLSTYVLPPVDFQYDSNIKKWIIFSYDHIEVCTLCCDSLNVYAFTPNGFVQTNKFCGETPTSYGIDTSDVFLFVFKSDGSVSSGGFDIRWNTAPI